MESTGEFHPSDNPLVRVGRLGLIVYGDVNGSLKKVWGTSNIGEGSGALTFLTGDFTGSGKTQIAQPWDNN